MRWRQILLISLAISSFVWSQTDNEEFRSTWVITWEHISGSSSVAANQARVREIMDNHVAANMNAVLWQVRQSGTAYYNSSFEPWGYYAGGNDPGYDPLEYAIEQAHARGLELHAWFNTFQAASTVAGTPSAEHPEWVCRDKNNNPMSAYRALSPGLSEVREYLVDVAMEIVNNYDIDGLHLDYVRWNEHSATGFLTSREAIDPVKEISTLDQRPDENVIKALADAQSGRYLYDIEHPYGGGTPTGYSSWSEFWRSSVTTFVHALHDSIQTQKPWVRLSIAALGKYNWSGWNGYDVVYQDAALWFNEGYIDQLTPMHYHWTTSSGFYDMLTGGSPDCWGDYIQPGINAGRLYSVGPGSYIFDQYNVWSRHSSVVNTSRSVGWVDGFQFFSYGSWQDHQYWPEAGATFFDEKTKIRDMGIYVSDIPVSPSVSLTTVDPLTFDITVTPDASVSENQWWAVYRSATDDIDVDENKIIGIFFGSDPITVTEAFDGTQDHNSSYFYSATMLDRYWNESLPAASVESGVLASYAPVVAEAYPAHGDTIDVNSILSFTFSKTMDTESVETALDISPGIIIDSFSWSESDHRLLVYTQGNYDFHTSYTVTLSDAAVDINGTGLDGDADGTAGGNYSFTFHTKEVDEAGPMVLYSNPDLNSGTENFDVGGVVSFVFDEELDPASVTLDAISFKRKGVEQEFDFLLSGFYGKSVLDIKLYEPLLGSSDYSVTLAESISDTLGNSLEEPISLSFATFEKAYSEIVSIDNFIYTGLWWDPEGSGSTVGTIGASTLFGYTSLTYLPGSSPYTQGKKAAYLKYKWDTGASSHLLREYIPATSPQAAVHFDDSYVLQCYIYGDASNNKFRFCIDEGVTTGEVSNWVTIDWEGWRLVQWDLSDPSAIGSWIGNRILEGNEFRMDSFQMTWDSEIGAVEGKIYIDEVQVVKRISTVSAEEDMHHQLPDLVSLHQNYPNPFNPVTTLGFELPARMHARLTIFDVKGREIRTLIDSELNAGTHKLSFNGSELATGVYLIRLETEQGSQVRRMLLLK